MIDLAALKVKEKTKLPLPVMPLGYSEVVKTGDWTIVLGTLVYYILWLDSFAKLDCVVLLCAD